MRGKKSGGSCLTDLLRGALEIEIAIGIRGRENSTPLSTVVAVLPRPEIGDTRVQKFPEIRIRGGAKNLAQTQSDDYRIRHGASPERDMVPTSCEAFV